MGGQSSQLCPPHRDGPLTVLPGPGPENLPALSTHQAAPSPSLSQCFPVNQLQTHCLGGLDEQALRRAGCLLNTTWAFQGSVTTAGDRWRVESFLHTASGKLRVDRLLRGPGQQQAAGWEPYLPKSHQPGAGSANPT